MADCFLQCRLCGNFEFGPVPRGAGVFGRVQGLVFFLGGPKNKLYVHNIFFLSKLDINWEPIYKMINWIFTFERNFLTSRKVVSYMIIATLFFVGPNGKNNFIKEMS